MYRIFIISLFFCLCACLSKEKSKFKSDVITPPITVTDYKIIEVPSELKEISGITFVNDSVVAAIEDEHGLLYFFNINSKQIVAKFEFGKKGDYEDIVRVKEKIFVVESNGTIFEIDGFNESQPKVQKYPTVLKGKNDIESVTYQQQTNSLLMAVKGKNLTNKDDDDEVKNIYRFSLKTKKLIEEPVYQIHVNDIEESYKGSKLEEQSKKFLKAIGNKNLKNVVAPSSMTFHPNGDLYILSSINHFILVLNENGELKKIIPFIGKVFSQPEGICFSPAGDLYISNEGQKAKGNIIKINNLNAQ